MSIATKLQKILDSKAAIKAAIAGKGGTITDATPLDEYAQAIEDLPSGGGVDEFIAKEAQGQLTEIIIPNSVSSIADYAFYNKNLCTHIKIPASVISIGNSAFYKGADNTSEVILDIENGVEEIKAAAFRAHSVKRIVLPNSLTTLGGTAFQFCYKIQYVEIGTGIQSIGGNNFNYTRVQNMVIICKAVNPPTLGGTVFPANYTTGKIYVPDASVNDYKTATNWSTYAQYIFPMSDYQPT